MSLASISKKLSIAVSQLETQQAAAFTYNPLEYAWKPHATYLRRYGSTTKKVLLLGMNPGPFGMAQTGVPFGDVSFVRDYLGICEKVGRPQTEHPKRPILGFDCPRSEVSGTRLWGWAKEHFPQANDFFQNFFVINYCPLVFMTESGANLTPDKLPRTLLKQIEEVCDQALVQQVRLLQPDWVIGVGAFAEKQAKRALHTQTSVQIGTILHPSPASPRANRGWSQEVNQQLHQLGLSPLLHTNSPR